jgi:integrase
MPPTTAGGARTYDVRIWSVKRSKRKRATSYLVRWVVAGNERSKTFTTLKLADGFRAELLAAVRSGQPFDVFTGLPQELRHKQKPVLWLDHAVSYVNMKWPKVSPNHRRGIAETLTDVTMELMRPSGEGVDSTAPGSATNLSDELLRRVLFQLAFARGSGVPTPEDQRALAKAKSLSGPLSALEEPIIVRRINDRLMRRRDGRPAAPSTYARKRAVFYSTLQYAVERGLMPANPLDAVRIRRVRRSDAVDRRVVVNRQQAAALLAAVREIKPDLEAFFATLYYAAARPAEARGLRIEDLDLPQNGRGEIILSGSHQTAGTRWAGDGERHQRRELKHRAVDDVRPIPAHPDLVAKLRHHIAAFPTGTNGLLFPARTGRAGVALPPPYKHPYSVSTIQRVWAMARETAFTPAQVDSPLAKRPYDLRHACVSTWLNAGVPPVQVAEWAGHSVNVLLRVYAKCIDGEAARALRQIELALPVSNSDDTPED